MANCARNIGEALARFQKVLATRNIPAKRRKYFVMWVKRLPVVLTIERR